MSHLTPKKVKEHLEKLGYTNIPKQELQTFTRDLQRLVNYETSSRSGTDNSTYSRGRRGNDCRGKHRSELESIPENRSQNTGRSRCRSQMSHDWKPSQRRSDFFEKVGSRCPRSRRSQSVDDRSDSYDSLEETMRDLVGNANDDGASTATDTSVGMPPPQPATARQEWLPTVRDGAEELLRTGFRVRCDMLAKPIRSSPASRHRWYEEVWKKNPIPTEDGHYNIRQAVRYALDTYDFKPRPMPKNTDAWQAPLLRTQPDATYRMNYDNALNHYPLNVREKRC